MSLPTTGWQHVWECPLCGAQVAAGDRESDVTVDAPPPRCGLGHKAREMEQKLPDAMPFGLPDEEDF